MPESNLNETEELVRRTGDGDAQALDELFSRHRQRLERMVRLRMDRRLQGRLDPSDVLQEVYLEACRRLPSYLKEAKMPFFLWLRSITGQKIIDLHRHHLGAKARDARREVVIYGGPLPEATSAVLAAQLLGTVSTPSQAALRAEIRVQLQQALDNLDRQDREVLVLRHFEHLSNVEAAQELGIRASAASNRYVRALVRLKKALKDLGVAEDLLG